MNRKESDFGHTTGMKHRGHWLLPALLLLGCSAQAQAQCPGSGSSQEQSNCIMHNVILPQQQRQREEAERERGLSPPSAQEIAAARAADIARHGWGAYAASPGLARIGAASDQSSQSKAERAALKDCEKQGGQGCSVLGVVDNACLVVASNHNGDYALATARSDLDAAKQALEQCNQKSPDQVFRLHNNILCPGFGSSQIGGNPEHAADFARNLEVEFDKRPFWGAVASDGSTLHLIANATSAKLASERAVADCGAGCKLLAASKLENRCLVAAWVPGAAEAPMVVESYSVAAARVEALRKCAGATGQICAASPASCSSRERVAKDGDGVVRMTMPLKNVRAEDLRETLQPWVGMRTYTYQILWSSPDKFDDGGDLLATHRSLTYDYTVPAGRGRPARACFVTWNEVDDRMESYSLKGEGCRFLFK